MSDFITTFFQTDGHVIPAGYVIAGFTLILAAVALRGFWLKTSLVLASFWVGFGYYASRFLPMTTFPTEGYEWSWFAFYGLPYWAPILLVAVTALVKAADQMSSWIDRWGIKIDPFLTEEEKHEALSR
ncbi:hypothetical protein ACTQ49_10155 [Luteococcus sp. Sow4_B9]|uniref:hypothetical protein n=1 Tax=Luteococcus sp. Sow4_B9 TaxID=3438792 RepID=UPI003F94AAC1